MPDLKIDTRTVIKLIIWSIVVGAFLSWQEWSPGDVYTWTVDKIAGAWDWIMNTGIENVLLGATIVVPIFLISRLRSSKKTDAVQHKPRDHDNT